MANTAARASLHLLVENLTGELQGPWAAPGCSDGQHALSCDFSLCTLVVGALAPTAGNVLADVYQQLLTSGNSQTLFSAAELAPSPTSLQMSIKSVASQIVIARTANVTFWKKFGT